MKKEECLSDSSSCVDVDIEVDKTWNKLVQQSKKVPIMENSKIQMF